MYRLVEAVFEGSMPAEDEAELGLARSFNLLMGALAVFAACSAGSIAWVVSADPDLVTVTIVSCLALLVHAAAGLWLMEVVRLAPRLMVARIWHAAFRRLEQPDRLAVRNPSGPEPRVGLSGMMGDLAVLTRRLRATRDRNAAAMAQTSLALSAGRVQAQELANRITEDAARLAETATKADAEGARLSDEVVAATRGFDITEDAVDRAVEGISSLAGAVRGTTASAERMTVLAAQLSKVAHATQRSVADLDDRSAKLAVALDGVASALHLAETAGKAMLTAGEPVPSPEVIDLAGNVHALTAGCASSLRGATEAVRELTAGAGEAMRRTAEMSELIRSNHEVGCTITAAVQQQGEAITGILQQIYEGRSGFAAIRASVDAIGRAGATQADAVASVRDTAQRLPNHADAVADMLRDVPDFTPRDRW